MVPVADQIDVMESKLRDAMLASDMKRLDALLADDLVFTNQTGQRLTKADDLAAHNSGRLNLTKIDISDQRVRQSESFAIVTLVASVGGSFDGQSFSGSFAYTRRLGEHGWAVESRGGALLNRNLKQLDGHLCALAHDRRETRQPPLRLGWRHDELPAWCAQSAQANREGKRPAEADRLDTPRHHRLITQRVARDAP